MKIVAISDNHGFLNPYLPKGDILVIGGDLEPNGSPMTQAEWLDGKFRKWINKIRPNYKEVVMYGGNHSFALESYHYRETAESDKIAKIIDSLPVKTVILGQFELFGLKFAVTSYCMKVGRWAFGWDEDDYFRWLEKIKECDIMLCHGPPYGMLDAAYRVLPDDSLSYEHTGSKEFGSWIMKVRPKLVIVNHIHECYGKMTILHYDGKTTEVANTSQCNLNNDFKDRPVEIFI